MPSMTPLQLTLLAALTLVWGLNWPIMKLGIADYPPLTFRAISMWLGLPVLGLALVAASTWALGTHLLRRTKIPAQTLTLSFWMTVQATLVMTLLAVLFEQPRWRMPPPATSWAIAFNAVLIFGFAHATWFFLARSLPPVASTLSVMLIPVLGVFSGALWLGEFLHWQDWAAVALMLVALGSVLAPHRAR